MQFSRMARWVGIKVLNTGSTDIGLHLVRKNVFLYIASVVKFSMKSLFFFDSSVCMHMQLMGFIKHFFLSFVRQQLK